MGVISRENEEKIELLADDLRYNFTVKEDDLKHLAHDLKDISDKKRGYTEDDLDFIITAQTFENKIKEAWQWLDSQILTRIQKVERKRGK